MKKSLKGDRQMFTCLRILIALVALAGLWKLKKWMDKCDAELARRSELEKQALIDGPITDLVWSLRRESLEAVRRAKQCLELSSDQRSDLYRHRSGISSILRGVRSGIIDPEELETNETELQTLVDWVNELLGLQAYGEEGHLSSSPSQEVPD